MPYFEVVLNGGDRDERRAVRKVFDGREPDYTGHEVVFYVQRDYDIAKMRQNLNGVIADDMKATVKRSSKRHWDLKKIIKSCI